MIVMQMINVLILQLRPRTVKTFKSKEGTAHDSAALLSVCKDMSLSP